MNSVATEAQSISAYGPAHSTVEGSRLEPEQLPIGTRRYSCRPGWSICEPAS